MRIHHSGHYKAYTDNLNLALREAEAYVPEVADMTLPDLLLRIETPNEMQPDLRKLPANVSTAILNNGGGYINHVLFFNQLREPPGTCCSPTQRTALLHFTSFISRAIVQVQTT
jgi:Fe-Mn family superoxide dismutase